MLLRQRHKSFTDWKEPRVKSTSAWSKTITTCLTLTSSTLSTSIITKCWTSNICLHALIRVPIKILIRTHLFTRALKKLAHCMKILQLMWRKLKIFNKISKMRIWIMLSIKRFLKKCRIRTSMVCWEAVRNRKEVLCPLLLRHWDQNAKDVGELQKSIHPTKKDLLSKQHKQRHLSDESCDD